MIAVVDYHKGNLKSVERGLIGVGADARITDDVRTIADASAIVLPGVGSFTDASDSLINLDQFDIIIERIRAGVPFLGICLGLHLLYEAGEEGAELMGRATSPGFGLLPGIVRHLPHEDETGVRYKIPHVGWNSIELTGEGLQSELFKGIADGEHFYFTHSYVVPDTSATIATTEHSCRFTSAVQIGECAFGVQFHPEKSSDAGAHMLSNFVALSGC